MDINSKTSGVKLSICIPTYNRAAFIGETLQSIFVQRSEAIEVVVVDGASTDNTAEVVSSFQKHFPELTYHRGAQNKGVDRDMAFAVELARGEYCWLMSSDDALRPGSIRRMLEEMVSGDDIYLCDVTLCDFSMRPIRDTQFLSTRRTTNRFDLTNRTQLLSYLALATSNNALFCYISAIAFRRARWIENSFNEAFAGTGYAHVYSLLSFLKARCRLKYIPSPLVLNRAGNDSFSSQGIEKRYIMDFEGYMKLADQVFSRDAYLRERFLRVMTKEHRWYRIAKLRAAVEQLDRWKEIRAMLVQFGYGSIFLTICGILGRHKSVVNGLLYLNNKLARSRLYGRLRTLF
jgi:O-antigen biosynthesis alpha-1,3-abequosyltransferase